MIYIYIYMPISPSQQCIMCALMTPAKRFTQNKASDYHKLAFLGGLFIRFVITWTPTARNIGYYYPKSNKLFSSSYFSLAIDCF